MTLTGLQSCQVNACCTGDRAFSAELHRDLHTSGISSVPLQGYSMLHVAQDNFLPMLGQERMTQTQMSCLFLSSSSSVQMPGCLKMTLILNTRPCRSNQILGNFNVLPHMYIQVQLLLLSPLKLKILSASKLVDLLLVIRYQKQICTLYAVYNVLLVCTFMLN